MGIPGITFRAKQALCLALVLLLLLPQAAVFADRDYFSKSDSNNVAEEPEDAVITLEGQRGTLSDPSRGSSGNPVVISRKGVYRITGTADGVTILIREPKRSGNIYLVLDHVSMSNPIGACIEVQSAEKVILQCVGENSLSGTSEEAAVVYSQEDLTINGSGALAVSSAETGIHCKGSLRITGSELSVKAPKDGLKGKKGVYIGGGKINISDSYECIEGSEVIIQGGELSLYASDDAINASGKDDQGDVVIQEGTVLIRANGDAIDSNHSIFIRGGTVLVEGPANSRNSIFDKGDTPGAALIISNGTVLAIGSAEKAKNFDAGSQYARLEKVTGRAGDVITTDDGTGVSLTASRDFECVIYSSSVFHPENRIIVSAPAAAAEPRTEEWDLSVPPEITGEIRAALQEAAARRVGIELEPVALLGRQGDLLCVLCKARAAAPGAAPYNALVYLSCGRDPEIRNIYEIWIEAHSS